MNDDFDLNGHDASFEDRLHGMSSAVEDSENTEADENEFSVSAIGGVVSARGVGEGLVFRVDGRVPAATMKQALNDFIDARRGFLEGNEVALEWTGQEPEQSVQDGVKIYLSDEFSIRVKETSYLENHKRLAEKVEKLRVSAASESCTDKEKAETGFSPKGLFGGVSNYSGSNYSESDLSGSGLTDARGGAANLGGKVSGNTAADVSQSLAGGALWDDPDARIVYSTLRSGQKIETEHSVIIVGDVNSGAEIVAGGDIVVLGVLRGVAHAGAYDETGGGRFIFSLDLRPTQLRIGAVISRGASARKSKGAEIANVDGNTIVVEPYRSRTSLNRLK